MGVVRVAVASYTISEAVVPVAHFRVTAGSYWVGSIADDVVGLVVFQEVTLLDWPVHASLGGAELAHQESLGHLTAVDSICAVGRGHRWLGS